MADFTVRSDSVDVEQIMQQIRARIREKRGVDYTEEEIRELASVKLETFLDPRARAVRPARALPPQRRRRRCRAAGAARELRVRGHDALRVAPGARCAASAGCCNPLLKLFFNPNPLIHVLHLQSRSTTARAAMARSSIESASGS